MKTKITSPPTETCVADDVLREVWRIRDELSASYGHDVNRLFAETRERERQSGRRLVNLEKQRTAKTQ